MKKIRKLLVFNIGIDENEFELEDHINDEIMEHFEDNVDGVQYCDVFNANMAEGKIFYTAPIETKQTKIKQVDLGTQMKDQLAMLRGSYSK